MPQNPFLDLNANVSSPQINTSSYRPGRQAAKQRMDRSESMGQLGRRTKQSRTSSISSPSISYADDDASMASTSTMSSYKTIPNSGADGVPKIHAKTYRTRSQSSMSSHHNSSTDPTGNAGIMHQKEVILNRVNDMTQGEISWDPARNLTLNHLQVRAQNTRTLLRLILSPQIRRSCHRPNTMRLVSNKQ